MNKFGTSSDDKISLPEQIEIIKDALINSSNLRWDDYYWAAKFLFQNDEEGRTDNLIIESLENALVSGLNVYSNKEHFLDASRMFLLSRPVSNQLLDIVREQVLLISCFAVDSPLKYQ